MALIKCPECSTEVSDKAAACPKCAHPLATVAPPVVGQVTIEKTSKNLKLHYLAALFTMVVGCSMVFGAEVQSTKNWGAFAWLVGVVWMVVTKARRWWQHD
jgi:hypothetical protein